MALLRKGTLGWGSGVPGFLCLAGTLGKALGGLSFPVCRHVGIGSNGFGSCEPQLLLIWRRTERLVLQ